MTGQRSWGCLPSEGIVRTPPGPGDRPNRVDHRLRRLASRRLQPQRDARARAAARLLRMARVLGWSGPRMRSASARVRSYRGMARSRSPADSVGVGEVVARGQGVGVVGAEDPLAVGQGALVQGDGRVQVPRRLGRRRRGCCARSGCRGGRRRGSARGRPGCARTGGWPRSRSPGRLVGVGEVVARGQGVGVVGAEDPLAIGEGALVQGDGLVQVARPPGRRRRGCCARSGCRGGRRRGSARGRPGCARTGGWPRPGRPADW